MITILATNKKFLKETLGLPTWVLVQTQRQGGKKVTIIPDSSPPPPSLHKKEKKTFKPL